MQSLPELTYLASVEKSVVPQLLPPTTKQHYKTGLKVDIDFATIDRTYISINNDINIV